MTTVFITGANRGLGLELVKVCCNNGWNVIACFRNTQNREAFAGLKNLKLLCLDITDYEKVVCLSDVDLLKDLPIDIVINNAGSYGTKENTLDNLDPYEWIDVFKINTIAPIIVSKALMKNLVKGTRKIIANISSIKGSMSLNEEGGKYIYASSKAALNFSTKKLSIDLKDQGITVVSINPGWIKTRMSHPNGQIETSKSAQAIINILQKISLKDSGKFINYDGNIISW